MTRRWWLVLIGLAVFLLGVWGYDRILTVWWVGHTDLEVEFLVTDATTGWTIKGAEISVHSDGGLYSESEEESEKKDFTLITEGDGRAQRICHQCMCSGNRSGLGFTDTYSVHLPNWRYRVSALTYEPSQLVDLDTSQQIRKVRPVGRGVSKLVVQVSLQRSSEGP
jgi:hypothetical protein